MIKRILVGVLILGSVANASNLFNKRLEQVGAAVVIGNELHKKLDPQRRAEEEKKKQHQVAKSQARDTELENKIRGVFMAASGQEPSSPDAFAASYLHELKQRYASDYKARYKSLAKNRETESKFSQVYPHAEMQRIMRLGSKEEVRRAMDSRYHLLF
ncbi:MAG: hypothetical protein ACRCXX_07745 [Cetobacterium sp.]|uniref:hypothetical protein n=1 Tax=Cetobacterium sp. TaxID=2071632 RepID=UPI003F39701C